jgi:hypothetical protein
MGYHLWVNDEIAYAEGASEYRAIGGAAISSSDLFRPRDFSPFRRASVDRSGYQGQYASLGQINSLLASLRKQK